MKSKFKYHILLLLIGIINLIVLNYLLQLNSQQLILNDSLNYIESAQFLYNDFKAHYYRPFVMAFITGLPLLFSNSVAYLSDFSLIVNVFSWLSTTLILFEIAKHYLVPKKAFYISIIYLFLIGTSTVLFDLLSESIYIFTLTLAYYLLLEYYKSKNFSYLSIGLSLVVISMLIRPGAKFLAIIAILFFLRNLIKNLKDRSIVFLYSSILLVLIQCFAVKVTYGNFKISYIDSYTYYNYLGAKSEMFKNNKYVQEFNSSERDKYLTQFSYEEANSIAQKDFINQLTNNTFNVFKAYIDDLHHNTTDGSSRLLTSENISKTSYFEFLKKVFFYISKFQNITLTFIGFFLSLYFISKGYRRAKFSFLVAGFILYTIFISGVSCAQGDRFHIVTYPFVLILIAKIWSIKIKSKPFFALLRK